MLNKLICFIKGHKRGKLIDGPREGAFDDGIRIVRVYRCPRCAAAWSRTAKKK